jgi:hypothetical protein
MLYLYCVDLYNNMSMDEYHDVLPLLCRTLQHEKASLSRGNSVVKFTHIHIILMLDHIGKS